ncbi:DUF1774 domain-containing protein [Aspergillus undulatus]|uniref:DUF1774 domain-containing protein n=1 Tax=Aspergillus undulatus TaxID=1810928 RepID=UPI003CCE0178
MGFYNVFARRESHPSNVVRAYQVIAPLSWVLVLVVGIFYSIHKPADVYNGHTIWAQFEQRFTPFTINIVVLAIYWILLLLAQIVYVAQLFSKEAAVHNAANAASHFILNNLFVFAWILLWTRNYFWPAEVILIAHFINQHILFWRVRSLPLVSHLAVVAAPYAWTLIALFLNGAHAIFSHTPAAKIAAAVFIWVIFVIGSVHIFTTVDDLLGYSLSLLTFGLAIAQTDHYTRYHLQWIFAWVIFGAFLLVSLYLTSVKYSGRNVFFRSPAEPESTDAERAPLLDDSTPTPATTS